MPRLSRPFVAFALLFSALFARAESVRLLAPANGATLRGGSFAELKWTAAELPKSAEEWEAFLSLDGGKYYAFRITPHLDVELRSFTFVVPNVDTHDARILIRTGDEVHESHFEARGTFSIVRNPHAEETFRHLVGRGRAEAARDGDPAVVAWTDGARNGGHLTQQSSLPVRSLELRAQARVADDAPPILVRAAQSVVASSVARIESIERDDRERESDSPLVAIDLLLVCRRRNV